MYLRQQIEVFFLESVGPRPIPQTLLFSVLMPLGVVRGDPAGEAGKWTLLLITVRRIYILTKPTVINEYCFVSFHFPLYLSTLLITVLPCSSHVHSLTSPTGVSACKSEFS